MALCRKLSFAVYVGEEDMDAPTIHVRVPQPGKAPIQGERKRVKMIKFNDIAQSGAIDFPKEALFMTAAGNKTYVGTVDVPQDVAFVMYEMSPRDLNLLFMDSDYLVKMSGSKYDEWRFASMDWTSGSQRASNTMTTSSPQHEEIVQSPVQRSAPDEKAVQLPECHLAKKQSFVKKLWKSFREMCKV